jgi:hypothetical protein
MSGSISRGKKKGVFLGGRGERGSGGGWEMLSESCDRESIGRLNAVRFYGMQSFKNACGSSEWLQYLCNACVGVLVTVWVFW